MRALALGFSGTSWVPVSASSFFLRLCRPFLFLVVHLCFAVIVKLIRRYFVNLINYLNILSVWVSANITIKFKIMILSFVLMKTKCVFACLRLRLSLLELAICLCYTLALPAGGSAVGNRIVSSKFSPFIRRNVLIFLQGLPPIYFIFNEGEGWGF